MNELFGEWRLVATRAWDSGGEALPAPYGPEPHGIVVFNSNFRMMCVLTDGRASVPSDRPREYLSYMGTFRYADGTLTTRVDGTSDSTRLGTDQIRTVRFDGERLVLNPPPRQRDGVLEHRELQWLKLLR